VIYRSEGSTSASHRCRKRLWFWSRLCTHFDRFVASFGAPHPDFQVSREGCHAAAFMDK